MNFPGSLRSCAPSAVLFAMAALSLFVLTASHAAMPFSSATVTRVENQVKYGQMKGDHSETRLASAQDVVKASDFLLSETDSRAELQYPDGSIVRIGQNTIFSFDANTRTLHLKKGTFVAYVPKGLGGATIKTPSYTAAITGTTVKCSTTMVAVVEGTVALKDKDGNPVKDQDGNDVIVEKGWCAHFAPDGTYLGKFEFEVGKDGVLMNLQGKPLPGAFSTEVPLDQNTVYNVSTIPNITFEDVTNSPSSVADKKKTKTIVPPPEEKKSRDTPY